MSHYSIRRVVAAIAVLVIAVFAYRAVTLRSLEPRWDQASFAVWVQDIRQSDHLLPERAPGESFQSALQADSSSVAHQLTLRLYNKHHNLFTAASLAALSVLVSAFNVRYETQVVATIGVSALVAGVVAWFLLVSLIPTFGFASLLR